MDENKNKALNAALSQIEKQFGKNTVMRLGDNTVQAVEAVSTGSLTLDIALGSLKINWPSFLEPKVMDYPLLRLQTVIIRFVFLCHTVLTP